MGQMVELFDPTLLLNHPPYNNDGTVQMAPISACYLVGGHNLGRGFTVSDGPSLDEKRSVVASSNVDGHNANARDHFSKTRLHRTSVLPLHKDDM